MTDYRTKSYGRNDEIETILSMFLANRDIAMPGPRRLGKTFVLDRLAEYLPSKGWNAVKVEISGLNDQRAVFRELCSKVSQQRSIPQKSLAWITQRMGQAVSPRTDTNGPWYQPFITLDHETYFERLVSAMNDDKEHRWALLIDELPIFLKALHDKGPDGLVAARHFMNLISRLRANNPRVRWLITGSIGLEPLAQQGQYMGVLAKFDNFELQPLTQAQAQAFVCDQALAGALQHRKRISDAEAAALVKAVGWNSAFYLDAVAQKMASEPAEQPDLAEKNIEDAVKKLLQPIERKTFAVWDEHLQKHYAKPDQTTAVAALTQLAKTPSGANLDALLSSLQKPEISREALRSVLTRLHVEGFVTCADWHDEAALIIIRNPLLRRWWQYNPPQTMV